jgi:antitoxin (DNA-binding transcriptional repressor) of toxin-antitoxin stability system
MNAVVINSHDAQSQLSELVARACAGEEIVISLDGKSAVRLVAIPPEQPQSGKRPIGLDVGKVIIHNSFFDPLPDGFLGFN